MLANYIKTALRNIIRQKGYSAINILGLSAGLASVIIISMIIFHELSYDNFHEKKNRIFRLYTASETGVQYSEIAPVALPVAPAAEVAVPGIKYAVRISYQNLLVSNEEKKFYQNTLFVDENFFELFDFRFLNGNKTSAVKDPFTVVLSETAAEKYFGKTNPIGKSLRFDNKEFFRITGIIRDLPENSHLRGDIFPSLNSFTPAGYPRLNEWNNLGNDYAYLLLEEKADPSVVEKKLNDVVAAHIEEDPYQIKMQPLSSVHFSDLVYDNARTTPLLFLYVFGSVALLILFIACINFINLTTARSMRRFKEIGIRKTVGAARMQLIRQFFAESFLLTLISFLAASLITALLIGDVNTIIKQNISTDILSDFSFIASMLAVLVLTAVLSGAYPAFVLSAARPAAVLKNSVTGKKSGYSLRAALVVVQFAISVFLITGTITVYRQTGYLLAKDLGFPGDRIIVLENKDNLLHRSGEPFKNALLQNENIFSASFSSGTPGSNSSSTSNFTPEGGSREDELSIQIIDVDYDFLETYELKMNAGRFFSEEFPADTSEAYILNETAAKKLGGVNALGKRITHGSADKDARYRNIIGIMQDFNYTSLKENINPVVFRLNPDGGRYLSLQLGQEDIASTMDFIKKTSEQFSPAYPFEYFFIKDNFEKYYNGVSTMGKMLGIFTLLAILISCIGILGLVSFSTEQKSKEIGVRKVLGASVSGIVFMLCKEFVKWVLLANVLIFPAAYFAMNSFLESFAYRTDFNLLMFAVTLGLSLVITIITVSYHSIKAASVNPVESLKYE